MKTHYKKQVIDLEQENSRLKGEKDRLLDKLKLPEHERSSLTRQENDLAELKRRLDDAETRCADLIDENVELKQEVLIGEWRRGLKCGRVYSGGGSIVEAGLQ